MREKVVFEGEVLKYKPGLEKMYISRWCQMTKSSFRVYKNQMVAKGFATKPIIALPLAVFQKVIKSKFLVSEKGKKSNLSKVSQLFK